MEDEDIDLFSEKGIGDAALIPLLGMFDDHKEDVMPDYMAEQMHFADKNKSGLGSQLAAAIISDPLTWMSRGLSAVGKLAKAAASAKKAPALNKSIRNAAKSKKQNIDEYMKGLTPDGFLGHIDEATEEAAKLTTSAGKRQRKHLEKMSGRIAKTLPKAQKLHQERALKQGLSGPAAPLNMSDVIKETSDRQIALGIPILSRWGAKYDIPRDYSSWWKLYKDGSNKGGAMLAKTLHLSKLNDVPGVGRLLKSAIEPIRGFGTGWKIGREATVALSRTGGLTDDETKALGRWLSPDGAAPIAHGIHKATDEAAGSTRAVIEKLQANYVEAINKGNLSHEDAFKIAFIKLKIGKKSESGAALFGRLKGLNKDNTFFPKWGSGTAKGKAAIEDIITNAMEQHAKASKLRQQGRTVIAPVGTEASKIEDAFKGRLDEMGPLLAEVSEKAFETGRSWKATVNTVFRSGQSTLVGEKAYAQFITNVARDNDQLEQITKGLYTKLHELTQGKSTLSHKDVSTLVRKIIEIDGLPGEIAAAFHSAQVNPQNAKRVLASVDNFLKRQHRSLLTMRKVLKKGGLDNDEGFKKALGIFEEEVFPYLEMEGRRAGSKAQGSLVGRFNTLIKNDRAERLIFTPKQQRLMRRVNNKHLILGTAEKAGRGLNRYVGRQAGTLDANELDGALVEYNKLGQRALTQDEVLEAAADMPEIQGLLRRQREAGKDITLNELLIAMSKSGRTDTRIIPRSVTEEIPLWNSTRTRWTNKQAQETAQQWGFDLIQGEIVNAAGNTVPGTFRFQPRGIGNSEFMSMLLRGSPSGGAPPIGGFKSHREAMRALRRLLKNNPEYMQKYGPGLRTAKKNLRIASQDIEEVRAGLSSDAKAILSGKATKFDDAVLSDDLLLDYTRLNKLKARRALPKEHSWHEAPVIPTKERYTTKVADPRIKEELEIFWEKGGIKLSEGEISDWAVNYAQGRILLREARNHLARQVKNNRPISMDPRLLADIQESVASTGTIIRNLMESNLPKEFNEMMDFAKSLSSYTFEAARRAGVWMPGSPIAYLPRYFNKAGRAKISALMGEIDAFDGDILTRLGIKQAQYFKRQWDEMSIDDLNEVHAELSDIITQKGAAPKIREFHKRLNKQMEGAGIAISGLNKKLPWLKRERIETDPFLGLLQRFGVAQQDANLEQYFNNMLLASTGKNGDSLMLGGKVVGIVDDTGDVHSLPGTKYEPRVTKKAKGVEEVTLEHVDDAKDIVPKSILIELPDGTIQTIDNGILEETGFGLLDIGRSADEFDPGVKTTLGNDFARASLRSDLTNSMHRGPLNDFQATKLMGKSVVFGSQHNIVGLANTAAKVHEVTRPALRTFDAINYGIKSFQTIFRLPFHIANLSSGVFQAHIAGATPKNLLASYIDTMRFMFGNQDFAKRASMVTDLLDLGSETHSLGIINILKGEKSLIQNAARSHGSGDFANWLAKNSEKHNLDDLDSFEDLIISLDNGTEIDMREFIHLAGEQQLYGTFASSITRGSRAVSDNLVRIKMQTLEPSLGGRLLNAPKRLMEKMANVAETSEVINRTSTALALVREGHPIRRAIEIAKEAHVPYEKLTPFERSYLKRFSVYYTFPRHYMPWAWSRFAEDPTKLARISHILRDQNLISTQEGKPNLVAGDYRIDLGRMNANFEAAGMLGAFADRIMLPAAEALVPGVDSMDARKVRGMYSDAGISNVGGLAGMVFGTNPLSDPDREAPDKSMWDEATRIAWPLKIAAQLAGKAPKEGVVAAVTGDDERSPYVEYTPLEAWLTDSVFGTGTRKVREKHELTRANMAYRRIIKRLQLRMAATENVQTRDRYKRHIQEIAYGMRQTISETKQKDFQ